MGNIKEIKIISSLEKLYDSDGIPEKALGSFSMLRNEKKSFQIAIEALEDTDGVLNIATELQNLRLYTVEHLKSVLPIQEKNVDDYYRFSKSGYYPDLLFQLLYLAYMLHLYYFQSLYAHMESRNTHSP